MNDRLHGPNNREYMHEIRSVGDATGATTLDGSGNVVIMTGDGVERMSDEGVSVDALRLDSRRNQKTARQILQSARFAWELNQAELNRGVNG